MKKILALILTGVMLLSLPACGLNAATREPNKLDVVQATADTAFVYTSFETKRLSAGSEVPLDTKAEVTAQDIITKEQALEIALNNAGLTVDKVYDLEVDLDKEKTGLFWEVDFETLEVEYDYDIDATTGEIVKNKQKPQKTEVKTETKVEVTVDVTITKEQALEIALNNAGLTVDQVYDLEVEFDKEKTGTVWEVDFETLANEYEYKIDVTTGQIVKNKIEVND